MSTIQEFDFSTNLLKALLWEHNKAEVLESLIRQKQTWVDTNQRDFWSAWFRDVFNVDTANDFGLSIWGRILGVALSSTIESSRDKEAFGFGTNHKNFNNGNFARGQTGEQSLTTEQRRLVIKLRYFQLTSRGAVPEINEFLYALFGDQGTVYVIDSLDMTYATYFFNFEPDSQLRFILEKFDLLPRPAGVGVRYIVQVKPSFGFGVEHLNFENGSFGRFQ
jgi:hypothetical protein